ncbi:MAG: hybrid sensor histidine kinase/response regulator [Planctomycetes bacterium]|nr:hybrid sensor histidine kinase/response regulator [Planctomycetota bacterium]
MKWIEMGARDAATVVARVRQFHQAEHTIEGHIPVQVGELLTDVAELTRPQWRDAAQRTARDIELDLQLEDVPPVLGHPAELREVFTNLILNAVDALPKGGRITLRLRGTSEAVVVEVVDTGIGMPADVRLKCFEPFFSTKGSDGTGLGLSMCHGIVERHGGRIEIDSTPGHGTTFGIHLPVAAECASDEPHPSEAPLPNGRVLYIDDDPRVRMVVGAMLNQLGQQVDMAESGAEGLEMFHANEYDVVVTDLGMPNVDGSMVTSIVKTARPEQPVIMLTGWGAGPGNQLPSEAPDFVLSKPVTIRQLQEVLERVLRIP